MWNSEVYHTMPVSSETVVSDDIWNKFDADTPKSSESYVQVHFPMDMCSESIDNENCSNHPEIRHHDCMWAGLCISKEHNKMLFAKKDISSPHRVVPAGKSLLISRASSDSMYDHQQEQYFVKHQHSERIDNLESDGCSTRSETPQNLSESDTDNDQDTPTLRHDQFYIGEQSIECLLVPVSEVTGQCVRRPAKRKAEVNETDHSDDSVDTLINVDTSNQPEVRNTLSDHSYFTNYPAKAKKTEHLGIQTPSDSEEEIDVVSLEKPAGLSTVPSIEDHKILQSTVKTALNDKPAPRPRGRPPNSSRKRPAQSQPQEQKPTKRMAVQRSCQKKITNVPKNISSSISIPTHTEKSLRPSTVSSEDEPDTDKRNLHNNMERQRRIELRNAFDDLRCLVPELKVKEKAPKVAILRQGGKYCAKIREIEEQLIEEKEELKKRQEKLRMKLSLLRRCLAKKR